MASAAPAAPPAAPETRRYDVSARRAERNAVTLTLCAHTDDADTAELPATQLMEPETATRTRRSWTLPPS